MLELHEKRLMRLQGGLLCGDTHFFHESQKFWDDTQPISSNYSTVIIFQLLLFLETLM